MVEARPTTRSAPIAGRHICSGTLGPGEPRERHLKSTQSSRSLPPAATTAHAHCCPFLVASCPPQWRGTRHQSMSSATPQVGAIWIGVHAPFRLPPKCFRETVVCPPASTGVGAPDVWEVAMTTLPRTHCGHRLTVINGPSFLDATGLPFVFDSRCLRAACPKARRRASPGALQCPSTGREPACGAI